MSRYIFLLMLSSVYMPAWSGSLPSPLPETIYFSTSWCPEKEELAELSKHLELTMNRCCILKASPLAQTIAHPEALSPWSDRIYIRNSDLEAPCVGLTKEEEAIEKPKRERLEKELAEKARIDEESARIDEDRFLSEFPSILKSMTKDEFCVAYGERLREWSPYYIPSTWIRGTKANLLKKLKNEAARRKQKFDDSLVRNEKVKMGISECQLYATLGLPEDQNRTVGRWGVHIQHIYGGGNYVYTENGRVTSWQD